MDANHKNADRLHSPERYTWQNPQAILEAIGMKPGLALADIGAGTGFFTLPAAKRVGPKGCILAIDIDLQMLDTLRTRALTEGLTTIEYLVSSEEKVPLEDASVDIVLISNVLHEVPRPVKLIEESSRILRPGGTFAVIEWQKEETKKGPPLPERLAKEDVADALRAAGFTRVEAFEAGTFHYGLKATKRRNEW